jgi:4-carboxymuconolactone decarboxylase
MSDLSSPRIPPLPHEEWTDAARDVFGYWEGPEAREHGSRSNTMMTLANHPQLALASLDFGKYLLVDCSLSPRQKELVILRVAARYNSTYQWAHHVHSARQIGATDAEIEALRAGGVQAVWSPEEQALVGAVDQLCDAGRIDDQTWAVLAQAMDRRQLMDLLYSVGFFAMNAWAFGAMGVQLEPGFEAFSTPADRLVGGNKAGADNANADKG